MAQTTFPPSSSRCQPQRTLQHSTTFSPRPLSEVGSDSRRTGISAPGSVTMHMTTFAADESPRSLQLYTVDPATTYAAAKMIAD